MRDSVETKPQSGRPAKVQPQLPGKLFENPQITSAEMQNFLEKKIKNGRGCFQMHMKRNGLRARVARRRASRRKCCKGSHLLYTKQRRDKPQPKPQTLHLETNHQGPTMKGVAFRLCNTEVDCWRFWGPAKAHEGWSELLMSWTKYWRKISTHLPESCAQETQGQVNQLLAAAEHSDVSGVDVLVSWPQYPTASLRRTQTHTSCKTAQ